MAVIRLSGAIGTNRSMLSDFATAAIIEKAFKTRGIRAVALQLNSPGGSPAQSSLIAARIRRLAEEKSIPVFAFCEDVAASGGYWLATAADEIFADANSIIGSIGVISASFGFHEFLEKQGVERRVHTAGEDKSMLDPFRPEKPEDVERLKSLQAIIHQNFIDQVSGRRGAKLKDENLFTGEFWTGAVAKEKGLIDGIGHLVPVMKERYGDKTRFRVFTQKRSLFSRFGGPGMAELMSAADERALWARYGL